MSSNLTYSGTADRPDRAKAMGAVILVHALLAAIILSGLNAGRISRAVEQLTTVAIIEPPPPPPQRPTVRARKPQAMKRPAGAAPAKKAEAAPVVAPQPRLPLPSPIPAAKVAGTGAAPLSGASSAGTGTGAGGSGAGGGGSADFSRFTPAQLIRNLSRGDYRQIAAGRLPAGRAMVSLRIEPCGNPSQCRILRSSGDPLVDAGLCPLLTYRLRFRPALDDRGRPIAYQLQYVATWQL